MNLSAKDYLLKIKQCYTSTLTQNKIDILRELSIKNKTILYCYEKAKLKTEDRDEILHQIIKNLFVYILGLVLKNESDSLSQFVAVVKKKVIDNNKIDNALINAFATQENYNKTGYFVVKMLEGLSGTQYQKIFWEATSSFPKESIYNAVMIYLLLSEKLTISKLKEYSMFFNDDNLSFFTISIIHKIIEMKENPKENRKEIIDKAMDTLGVFSEMYDNNPFFYFPIFFGYASGILDNNDSKSLESFFRNKISQIEYYAKMVDLVAEYKGKMVEKLDKIVKKQDALIDEKEKRRDWFWETRLDENKFNSIKQLCEIISRFYHLKGDAELEKINQQSNLYQRIVTTISYIEGLAIASGVEIICKENESAFFDPIIHETLEGKALVGKVRVIVPGFLYKDSKGIKQIFRKALVIPEKELKK